MNSYSNIKPLLAAIAFLSVLPFATAEETVSFRADIAPILLDHCVACHSAKNAEGGYRLDTFAEIGKPGDSDLPPLTTSGEDPSELVRRITSDDEFERMPAESSPLSDAQIKLVSAWIAAGAKFDGEDPAEILPLVIPPPRHQRAPAIYPSEFEVAALTFSPDGTKILSGGYHEILVWDLRGNLVRRIGNIDQRTFAIAFHPDGKHLAVACGEPGRTGEVRWIQWDSGEVKAVLGRTTDVVLDVAFRPESNEIAIASADKSIRIVNLETLQETTTLMTHADWVTSLQWTSDGKRLVSASRDKSVKVFDVELGQLLVSYQGHGEAVRGVSLSADDAQAWSVGGDNKLHRWNLSDAKKISELTLGGEGFRLASGDGWLLVPTSDHRVLKIDTAKNTVLTEFNGHTDWVLSVAVSPDQTSIASGSQDGEIRIWNAADGTCEVSWSPLAE